MPVQSTSGSGKKRAITSRAKRAGRSVSGEDIPVLKPEAIRRLPERQALVVAENGKPLIAKLTRCIDGKPGRALLDAQRGTRERLTANQDRQVAPQARATAALVEARRRGLDTETGGKA